MLLPTLMSRPRSTPCWYSRAKSGISSSRRYGCRSSSSLSTAFPIATVSWICQFCAPSSMIVSISSGRSGIVSAHDLSIDAGSEARLPRTTQRVDRAFE